MTLFHGVMTCSILALTRDLVGSDFPSMQTDLPLPAERKDIGLGSKRRVYKSRVPTGWSSPSHSLVPQGPFSGFVKLPLK